MNSPSRCCSISTPRANGELRPAEPGDERQINDVRRAIRLVVGSVRTGRTVATTGLSRGDGRDLRTRRLKTIARSTRSGSCIPIVRTRLETFRESCKGLVVPEHGVEDVGATAGERDQASAVLAPCTLAVLSYKPATIASDGEEVTVTMLEVP